MLKRYELLYSNIEDKVLVELEPKILKRANNDFHLYNYYYYYYFIFTQSHDHFYFDNMRITQISFNGWFCLNFVSIFEFMICSLLLIYLDTININYYYMFLEDFCFIFIFKIKITKRICMRAL